MIEPVTFDKGIANKRDALFLEDGELVISEGFSYEHKGYMESRSAKTAVNTTAYGSIHTLHRYINHVILGDGGNVRVKWDLDGFCDLYIPVDGDFTLLGVLSSSNRLRTCDYKEFTFIVNGSDKKAISQGNMYGWGVDSPDTTPSGTAGDGGEPDGTYTLYYTYLILFPSGRTYETAPSPAGEVTVTDDKISWSNIGVCNYSGIGLKIYRKLYRYSTGLAATYYVATIKDNTTTTYTDDESNTVLQSGAILSTASNITPPERIVDITNYLDRIFAIKDNYLYWSEPYIPFAFRSANNSEVTRDGEDLVVVLSWGDQLYMASTKEWKRLQGSDSATWNFRDTFARVGVINRDTVKATRYGILGLWHDGVYLFDGTISKNITEEKIGGTFFTDLDDLSVCIAEFDGARYWLRYASSGTTLDKCLVIDFSDYPNLKFYHDNFIPTAFEYHIPTGIKYYGKSDGYQYEEGMTETIATELQTGDRAAKNIYQQKQTEYLYYDIYTNSKDVTVTIYANGVAQTPTYTLNNSARTRKRIKVGNFQGYRFSIKIECADSENLKIYEPWGLQLESFGV